MIFFFFLLLIQTNRMEKHIQDLQRKILNSDKLCETWKRKCEVYQGKYEQMKKTTAKTGVYHKGSADTISLETGNNVSGSSGFKQDYNSVGWAVNNAFQLSTSNSINLSTNNTQQQISVNMTNSGSLSNEPQPKPFTSQSSSGSLSNSVSTAQGNNTANSSSLMSYLPSITDSKAVVGDLSNKTAVQQQASVVIKSKYINMFFINILICVKDFLRLRVNFFLLN